MTMLFIMGVLLVFAALGLAGAALRNAAPSTGVARSIELIEAMTTAPSELTSELDKSFSERVLIPLQNRFSGLGRRLSGSRQRRDGSVASSTWPATRPDGRWTG